MSLSDKIQQEGGWGESFDCIEVKDVKEAVEELIFSFKQDDLVIKRIKEIFGKELTE